MPFLLKTEPAKYSFDDLVRDGETIWDGISNPQALRSLREMHRGEKLVIYNSNTGKAVVGVVEVVREAYPDPTAEAGPWVCVDLRAVAPLPRPVPLAAMKAEAALAEMALLRQSRLSVSPVSDLHWRHVLNLAGWME